MPLPDDMLPRELRRRKPEASHQLSHAGDAARGSADTSSEEENDGASSSDDVGGADDVETSSCCTDTSETDLTEWRKQQAASENKSRRATLSRP